MWWIHLLALGSQPCPGSPSWGLVWFIFQKQNLQPCSRLRAQEAQTAGLPTHLCLYSTHHPRKVLFPPLFLAIYIFVCVYIYIYTQLQTFLYISVSHFSCSVMSDSLQPHGLQHARPPCPSPTPGVYSNSCPLSWQCNPTISPSVISFSSCPQFFPASGSFQMSQPFVSGGQSTRVSALTSVLPMNSQDWSPLGWIGRISLQSKGLSRVFSNTTVQKHQFFGTHLSL